jgi:hypothetical protein
MGVGVGAAVGIGVAVGTEDGVGVGVVVAGGRLAAATGEGVGVAACPAMDVPIIATIAAPTAIAPMPTVVLRFTLFLEWRPTGDSLGGRTRDRGHRAG